MPAHIRTEIRHKRYGNRDLFLDKIRNEGHADPMSRQTCITEEVRDATA